MTTPQRKIGSGFGARSTVEDVLRGLSLAGKLAIVTGGYSGLGLATTRGLAGAGARVIVPARRPAAAATTLAGIPGVEVDGLDLADLASVRGFGERIVASGQAVDILINNAAIMACPETRIGPGWEAQFAINHLGHFALVNHLWPAIVRSPAARVVAVSSGANPHSRIRWDDVWFTRGYDKWQAYAQSKWANVLLAAELDKRGQQSGVRAFSARPGYILTPLQRHLTREEMIAAGWIDANGTPADPIFKTVEQGAATQVWAATSPQLAGMGGVCCEDCDVSDTLRANTTEANTTDTDAADTNATDDDLREQAARLWRLSASLTAIDAVATAARPRTQHPG